MHLQMKKNKENNFKTRDKWIIFELVMSIPVIREKKYQRHVNQCGKQNGATVKYIPHILTIVEINSPQTVLFLAY